MSNVVVKPIADRHLALKMYHWKMQN